MNSSPLALEDMQNKILAKRKVLEASIASVNYKIDNLKPFFSREQIRCWYIQRNSLCAQLKELPTEKEVREWAKRTTEIVKQIHNPHK